MPARFQHTMRFCKSKLHARHVADAESDGISVKTFIGKRQCFGIALHDFNIILEGRFTEPIARNCKHVFIDVEQRAFVSDPPRFCTA